LEDWLYGYREIARSNFAVRDSENYFAFDHQSAHDLVTSMAASGGASAGQAS
jgi:hypothetical protein